MERPKLGNALGVRWERVGLFQRMPKAQGIDWQLAFTACLNTSKRNSPDPFAKKIGLKLVAAFGPVSYRDY